MESRFETVSRAAGFYFALDLMPLVERGCWGDPHSKVYFGKDDSVQLICPKVKVA